MEIILLVISFISIIGYGSLAINGKEYNVNWFALIVFIVLLVNYIRG